MFSLAAPLWLCGLALIPLLRWLHRWRGNSRLVAVSALFLWRQAAQENTVGRRLARPDPRWRLRAGIIACLLLALAGPRWRLQQPPLEVWVDDSLSMSTQENGGSRLEVGIDRLLQTIRQEGRTHIGVHSLSNPAKTLVLNPGRLEYERTRLLAELPAAADDLLLPAAVQLDRRTEHWLVSDGAKPALQDWLTTAPITRVIQVGGERENIALTRLAARPSLTQANAWQVLLSVANLGEQPAARELELRLNGRPVYRQRLELTAGATVQRELRLPAGGLIQARLSPADALALDNELTLSTPPPVSVHLVGACGSRVRAALAAHPRLQAAATAAADVTVACGEMDLPVNGPLLLLHPAENSRSVADSPRWQPAAGALQQLVLEPAWLSAIPAQPHPTARQALLLAGATPLIMAGGAADGRVVDLLLDMETPAWTRRPEYPLLLAGLLNWLLQRELLDEIAGVEHAPAASRIAPQPLRVTEHAVVAALVDDLELSSWLFALSGLLLLIDLGWAWRRRAGGMLSGGQIGLRVLVLGLVVLAWWNPAPPWRRAPRDVIVLLDDSLSMNRMTVAAAWTRLAGGVAGLPSGSRFAVVRFAATPVLAIPLTDSKIFPATPPPRQQALDRSASGLQAALEFGLRLADPRRAPLLVLLSDGLETQGQARIPLQLAKAAAAPVYGLKPVSMTGTDAWIESLALPARVRLGQRAPVTVTVAGALSGAGSLQLWLNGALQTEQQVKVESGQTTTVPLWLEPATAGSNQVEVKLQMPGDEVAENNTRAAILTVTGPAPVVYVSAEPGVPPAAASLQQGGWPLRIVHPQSLLQQLGNSGVIILDDIAVADMEEPAWLALAQTVRNQGTGLIVLGGPHSFGAGGYRHSTLESLLPVIAAGAKPQPPAAVLFVVDKSGSMDQAEGGLSRLALAHRAVTETALSLQDGDVTGLLAFDVQPRWLLPPSRYPHPAQALESAWQSRAAGGTRLQPALTAAVEALAATPVEQRLLVLVTDGFVEGEDFGALQSRLAAAGITVIALAVGEADTTVLQGLAGQHDGKLLRVRELATLPRLMRQEVARQRAAVVTGASIPRLVQPLPWMSAVAWPPLQGYMVTQVRPEASIYLQSAQSEPLLAMQQTGSGRVLVLPGGLGDWARSWLQWPEFGRFLGGLVTWAETHDGAPRLQLTLLDGSGELQATVDALGEDQDWSSAGNIAFTLRDPGGRLLDLRPEITAPGRYVARLPVQQNGPYRVTAWAGEQAVQQDILHAAADEFLPSGAAARNWADWLEQGLLQPWPVNLKDSSIVLSGTGSLQTVLTLLAGVLYLGLLSAERGLLSVPVRRFLDAAGGKRNPVKPGTRRYEAV